MGEPTSTVDDAVDRQEATQARRASWAGLSSRLVLLAGAGVTVLRWWTSRQREVFHLTPDEPGQLAIARFVGGMARWNMLDRSTWRPAYGTLISPIHWLTDDPVTAFRGALAVNAILGGVAVVLLCFLARRLTSLSPSACVAAAVAVTLAPGVLFMTNWAWSESLVAVTFLAAVLAMLRFEDRPTLRRGLAVVVLAATGFLTHSRLLPLVAVAVGLVIVQAARRRITLRLAAGLAICAGVLTWATTAYSAWLVERIWEAPRPTNTIGGVIERLTDPAAIALSATGQVWYQLVATAGLAGVGAVALVAAARRGQPGRSPAAARIAVVTIAALVGLSMVFMSDRLRPDQVVYGRYNDAVVTPLVLVGIAALVTTRRRHLIRTFVALGAVTVVAAAALDVWRSDALSDAGAVRPMTLGILAFITDTRSIDVRMITVLALGVMAFVLAGALLIRWTDRRAAVLLVLAPLLIVGYLRTQDVVDRSLNTWVISQAAIERLRDALPAGEAVRFRVVPNREDPAARWGDQRLRTMLYQFYLPTNPMASDGADVSGGANRHGADDAAETRYVFAPLGDPQLEAAGAEVIWRDPKVRIGLWLEPADAG